MADTLSATHVHAEEWSGEDVGVGDIVTALCGLRDESAHETEGPDMRTSVMTHLAWVPAEWEAAALDTLAGLEERHPSRGILLFPEPEAEDGIDARITVLAYPLREQRRHIAAEVIELRLRGRSCDAPASIVNPLLVPALPVFLRWRGRPQFGQQNVEQLVEVCDRLIVDSREWPDVPKGYAALPFDRTACSDIAWRRTEPWRRCLARLWPGIAELQSLRVQGPTAEASLLAGWLSSRLERDVELEHEDADELKVVDVDGDACPVPKEQPTSSDLLSAELDEFSRDRVYEAAALAAVTF
jgi:Glucose-6-phosphate dehydrogenase subunit N-terminal domain/Glucose-6-phosphate dehydrogenase subunit C-terminal domain